MKFTVLLYLVFTWNDVFASPGFDLFNFNSGNDMKDLENEVVGLLQENSSKDELEAITEEIRSLIWDNVMPDLKKEFALVQTEMAGLNDFHKQCPLEAKTDPGADIDLEHQACRKEEAALKLKASAACTSTEFAHAKHLHTCIEFKMVNNLKVWPREGATACKKEFGKSNEKHFEDMKDYFKDLLDEWDRRHSNCQEWTTKSKGSNQTCANATEIYSNKTDSCKLLQKKMDSHLCGHWMAGENRCKEHYHCWKEAAGTFVQKNTSIAKQETYLKGQLAALLRTDCILGLFNSTNGGTVGTCQNKTHSTSMFDVTYAYLSNNLPKAPPCNNSGILRPGTLPYVKKYYENLPQSAPADACVAECCSTCKHFDRCAAPFVKKPNSDAISGYSKKACCDAPCNVSLPRYGDWGSCVSVLKSGQTCKFACDPGFESNGAPRCSDGTLTNFECENVDECTTRSNTSRHNCDARADCMDTHGSFTCSCQEGYQGDGVKCTDVDECASGAHNCGLGSRCNNTAGSFTCSCREGFTGNGLTCADINECFRGSHNCHSQAICRNSLGSFSCDCKDGFAGDGVTSNSSSGCTDVDECRHSLQNCGHGAKCTNTAGSFTCSCQVGYAMAANEKCVNVNECRLGHHNCHAQADCVDTMGSFMCSCKPGYKGDGVTCIDVPTH
eukprot:TRINITY_DN10634_c0_g2_i1.p1 TRINITY_DN10634_c0_g2~~TRINITY_DN10634_c0_g2_i1.p1  ORF type:complete len:669 (+),score=129.35 TRINITY_DN10634_c0_g2_i1:66-2072(+)